MPEVRNTARFDERASLVLCSISELLDTTQFLFTDNVPSFDISLVSLATAILSQTDEEVLQRTTCWRARLGIKVLLKSARRFLPFFGTVPRTQSCGHEQLAANVLQQLRGKLATPTSATWLPRRAAEQLASLVVQHEAEAPLLKEQFFSKMRPHLDFFDRSLFEARLVEVCVALQELELPALVTLHIIDELEPNNYTMFRKWQLAAFVKHWRERRASFEEK